MQKHSHAKCGKRKSRSTPTGATKKRTAAKPGGFLQVWEWLLGHSVLRIAKGRGRPARVPLTKVIPALVFHVMSGAGTLAEHFFQLFNEPYADSSWSARRARLPWEVFEEVMRRMLRPRSTRRQTGAFWRGWRLVALDGTQFSLANTPAVKKEATKARSRRGRAAFAKLGAVVLLEIGLHNPLAAAIGRRGQSEWELSRGLLARLPKQALLLADRLYGCAAFAAEAMAACRRVGSHFLFRVRSNIKAQTVRRYKDGSRLIRVGCREKGNPSHIAQWLEVREIRARVRRKGFRPQVVRLWTSLLAWQEAPAPELARLYTQRWEHELYYREIKRQLRKTDLLQSQTVETGAQEIAAIILASALIATERARAAGGQWPALRISFIKVLELLQPLWLTLQACDDLLSEKQKQQMTRRFYQLMGQCVTQRRRARSCPRAVRQPVTGWPRLRRNRSITAPIEFNIV
jgi:Transposase DDE domain